MQDAQQDWEEAFSRRLVAGTDQAFPRLRMWLPLQLLGLKPFRAALEEKVLLCRYFYHKVHREAGF